MLTVGGKKKTKFKTLAGMPQKGSPGTMEYGLTNYDYMPTIPGKRYGYKTLKGMPNTRQLNGGWGDNHPGKIGGGTKSLLANKRNSIVEDPQDRREKGKVKLTEQDPSGFLNDKVMPNASVTCTDAGFCLKGEEDRTTPSNDTFYGMKDGKRGWYKVGAEEEKKENVPSGGIGGGMFAWDESSKTMGPGGAMVGRTWVEATGTGEKGDGEYWLKVSFSEAGANAEVVTSRGDISDTDCYIPIYIIVDGKIETDLRGAFVVPCWE